MFLYKNWMDLPLTTRMTIAQAFGVAKTMPTHVFNNQVIQDGYDLRALESALNVDAIQRYVGTEDTDMQVLWNLLVTKAEGREPAELQPQITVEEVEVISSELAPGNKTLSGNIMTPGEILESKMEIQERVFPEQKKRGRKPKTK